MILCFNGRCASHIFAQKHSHAHTHATCRTKHNRKSLYMQNYNGCQIQRNLTELLSRTPRHSLRILCDSYVEQQMVCFVRLRSTFLPLCLSFSFCFLNACVCSVSVCVIFHCVELSIVSPFLFSAQFLHIISILCMPDKHM